MTAAQDIIAPEAIRPDLRLAKKLAQAVLSCSMSATRNEVILGDLVLRLVRYARFLERKQTTMRRTYGIRSWGGKREATA